MIMALNSRDIRLILLRRQKIKVYFNKMTDSNHPILKSLRIQFNAAKFKFAINDLALNFADLKILLLQRLIEMNLVPIGSFIKTLVDEEDFELLDSDVIGNLLSQNDLLKITSVSLPVELSKNEEKELDTLVQQSTSPLNKVAQESKNSFDSELKVDLQLQDNSPIEAIVILFDVSGSMKSSFFTENLLSRMGAVNAFFSAFADKTLAYELKHIVQLFTFDDRIDKKCEFTEDMNFFIHLVDGANPRGSTRLYDALIEGVNSLVEVKKKYPNIILRIIALTDGEDNQSKFKPIDVAKQVIKNRIILDSFVVSHQSQNLKTITHASGGHCYCPEDLMTGMKLFEIETILSVRARDLPSIDDSEIQKQLETLELSNFAHKPFDSEGIQVSHEKQLKKEAVTIEDILKKYQDISKQSDSLIERNNSSGKSATSGKQPGNGSVRRVIKEIEGLQCQADDSYIKIFPESENIQNWKVLMIGPKDTIYNGGVFMLYVQLPSDYPFKPPSIRFLTPVYHCNVSSQGRVCLDILKDQWSPALTVEKALLSIHCLLASPNPDDSLDSNIAAEMKHEKDLFKQKCKSHVINFANPRVEEILINILGESADKSSSAYKDSKLDIELWVNKIKSNIQAI